MFVTSTAVRRRRFTGTSRFDAQHATHRRPFRWRHLYMADRGCSRRQVMQWTLAALAGAVGSIGIASNHLMPPVEALQGVNRPDLLPKGPVQTVIDRERFLVTGQRERLRRQIQQLEADTGIKVRLLTQRYPETPGLAIKDYWGVDENTVVMVVDFFGGVGGILKFNIGANVDKVVPPGYWSSLSNKYGNKFYLEKNGVDMAIVGAVEEGIARLRAASLR
ncbi:hypothetical protein CDCA_CDCA11G3133 [Cyanidium caldarium]|uniref:TPM domain-containing protein n=1 Tax=Cyanidium caldarium TaxID=2771 RepID=A0AAV9IZ77_CYACA|nr:hypothetical protein CDCA_CDCA11G3133 [Cyanidium caldarium]